MRAFMSTTDSHLRLPYPSEGLARHYATQAEIEARAILAVTEPDTNDWREIDWQNVREPFTYLRSTLADVALAEALAAFVAEGE